MKNQIVPPVFKTLTKTMIDKGNPDCFKQLVSLARLFGVNFDDMNQGDRAEIPLVFTDGVESIIRFYVVHGRGGRKDKRYNIPAAVLREQASVGDTIAFTFKHDANGKAMLCVNVTRQPEYNYLTTSGGCVARAITEGMNTGRWYTRDISRGYGVSDESYATREKAQKAANYRMRTEGSKVVVEFYETDSNGDFKEVIA